MVCKEDVLLWFKDLEGYKRIDVLYELLNMCIPLELRFLGSCIEEIGKHTYQELRGPAINANDLDRLSKDTSFTQGLLEENVRHRVLICLSLLSSRNYCVANWLYKNILRTDWLEDCIVKGNLKDENIQSEFLLLFVMALHHPAFTFEQKLYFHSILTQLIDLRESKKRISPKPSGYGYPPGFGYPTIKTMNTQEIPLIPVKTSITIPCGDDTLHQQPPGLPHIPSLQATQDFVAWNLPGFPCGAPEIPPPFPMPTVSPLVSESTSPNHSRSTSPHRTIVTLRSTPMPPPQPQRPIDIIPTQLPIDPLSSNNFPFLHPTENVKMPEEDLNSIPEEKLLEASWISVHMKDVKQPNGIRYGVCPTKHSPRLFAEQFQALSIDGENSLHRSNSSSSSSLNQTPPETPAATPHSTSQCRGGEKPRVNGMPSFVAPGGLPLCDTTSPPPPPTQTFNNCSVPYTTYPPFTAIPTRSMFPYTQSYRPPFTHFPSFQTNDNSFPTYSLPYMPIIYSSQYPPRTSNCYNCGAMGHAGQDCTGQNIEDITQKKTYTIEFSPSLPDADK